MRASTALKAFSFACLILILLVYVVPLYALFQDLNDGKFYFGITSVKEIRKGKGYLINVTLEVKDNGSTVLSDVMIYALFNISGKLKKIKFEIGQVKPVMEKNYTESIYVENLTSIKFVELEITMKIGGILPVVMKFARPPKPPSSGSRSNILRSYGSHIDVFGLHLLAHFVDKVLSLGIFSGNRQQGIRGRL